MGTKAVRSYSVEEKSRATKRAIEIGLAAAEHELGIPHGTLWRWVSRGQVKTASEAKPLEHMQEVAPPETARGTRRARVAKVYTPGQIAEAIERIKVIGLRPTAVELGISRTTLRDWERKVARAAKGEGPAPTSGPDPKSIEGRPGR